MFEFFEMILEHHYLLVDAFRRDILLEEMVVHKFILIAIVR